MLAFGIKATWFSLSLIGFLSNLAALPAFAQTLDGWLIPILYTGSNFVLQAMFCLGMIWRMDPLQMPRAFCILQPTIAGISWSFMTVITTCMTIATSLAILRPAGGMPASPAYIRSLVRWHPTCLLMVFFPVAALTAYLVLALKFNAIQPTDGMNCDATNPTWVRLLSYSGVPLLLALPSLLLTCTAAFQHYAHSPRTSRSFIRSTDLFTPVPLRRQSKYRDSRGWQEAKSFDQTHDYNVLMPSPSQTATGPSTDQRSMTPSGTIVVAEAIPSPPDSISSARARQAQGRAPISPDVAKPGMRYHLPFQWQPPPRPASVDPLRDSPDQFSISRGTPSPLVFATAVDERSPKAGGPNTTHVAVLPENPDRLFEAAPWLKDEKAYLRQLEKVAGRKLYQAHQDVYETIHDDDENYDAIGIEVRWNRDSGDTASTAKSELEFARTPQREAFDEPTLRRSPPGDPSTYDAGLSEPPIPTTTLSDSHAVWRILFFQLFSSATQIVATVSSLVDMFMQHHSPAPFGTQHVALLLAAWAPPIAFGVLPWRRKVR